MKHRTDPRVLLVVSATSGAGKTTLIERLLPALRDAGLRVGAIKRTHHDVDPDPEGSDSRRLREAGAAPVILRGPRLTTICAPTPVGDEVSTLVGVAAAFGPLDLVLVEGGREIPVHARIEVVADGASLPDHPGTLLAVAADVPVEAPPGVPCFARGDVAGIADLVASWVRG